MSDEPWCSECSGPFDGWLLTYGGHWDTCPNRVYVERSPERIGWWRIGKLELFGRHSWAQEVAAAIGGELTPAII